jgi:putative hemolysin
MESIQGLYLILFVICVFLSAFFSSAETSVVSLSKLTIVHLSSTGVSGARRLEKLVEEPGKFLAAILLGNNLVNVAAAALGTLMAVSWLDPALGALVATIGVTAILLIFGEVIPKTLATHHAERMALLYSGPIKFIMWILYPFVIVLNRIGISITKIIPQSEEAKKVINEDEIRTAITVGKAEGVWEEDEAKMLHKVFEFADRPVREIMTPRTEIVWIEKGTVIGAFLDVYRQYPHSRFPVYHGTTDNVVGILFIKDLLKTQSTDAPNLEGLIDDLIRPAFFVPESKKLGTLLNEMKDSNYNMVIIIDEFGGVAGMTTMEEIIEEIVGGIGDELAENEKDIVPIDANSYEVDGGLRIEEANDELGLNLPEGEYETMAGFVLSHLGRIPKQSEHFKYKNLKLAVIEMRGMKIERILITKEVDATPKN